MTTIELRTGAWYDDRPITLTFPDEWDVVTHWPRTPAPMDDAGIAAAIAAPVAQARLSDVARGKTRPLIVVDDTSRPTPVHRLMPFVLRELADAGVPAARVRVLVATGTHGKQHPGALERKLGKNTMASCQVLVHRDTGRTKFVGVTAAHTPVYVNPEVTDSDLVIGIGGIYPQHTTGFGGGAKLALGVLGRKSIARLHFTHGSVEGTYDINNDFRRDLEEIARMIGLGTMFTVFSDRNQDVVHLICGDHFRYYNDAVAYTHAHYDAPAPADADIVIANAYPSDVSVYFMRKAMAPVEYAPDASMKVMVASNHGGLGFHGIYYPTHNPRLNAYRLRLSRLAIHDPATIAQKVVRRILRMVVPEGSADGNANVAPTNGDATAGHEPTGALTDTGATGGHAGAGLTGTHEAGSATDTSEVTVPRPPDHVWVYAPPPGGFVPDRQDDGMTITDSWQRIIDAARKERPDDRLRVHVYPCASLQCVRVNGDRR